MMNSHPTSSAQSAQGLNRSEVQSRRKWSDEEEEGTLIDGLKEVCTNGWRADNGTFKHGYGIELEKYINKRHPGCGIRNEPHITSKMKGWKKNYGTLALLKSRSGLGFLYGEGKILVDDPKAWDDFIKIDPNAKGMNIKTWPYFEAWEEIFFGKDRATGEFAEGPQDAVEEIERTEGRGFPNNMSLEIPIDIDDEEDVPPGNDPDIPHRNDPDVPPGEADNAYGPSAFTGASQSENDVPRQIQQGNNSSRSSSQVNNQEKNRKRKRNVEYDDGSAFKDLMDVMKQYAVMQEKNMATLIDKLGERDQILKFVKEFQTSFRRLLMRCTVKSNRSKYKSGLHRISKGWKCS